MILVVVVVLVGELSFGLGSTMPAENGDIFCRYANAAATTLDLRWGCR